MKTASKNLYRMSLIIICSSLISACLRTQAFPTLTPTETFTVTFAPTLTPSPTDIPPSATPTYTETPSPTATPTFPPQGYGPENYPDDINPLTGLKMTDPSLLNRRPVSIKVNVVPRNSNRPPWGLFFADIVYDYYHNDGYSRFNAIFYGNDSPLVGPIRSARLLDDAIVQIYKGIFAYGGADQRINYRILNSDYFNRIVFERGNGNLCPPSAENPLCRLDPSGYDFLLAGTQELHKFIAQSGVEDARQDLSGMFFHTIPPPGGSKGIQITTRYSKDCYNRWEYDPVSGHYLRLQDNIFDEGQGEGEQFVPLFDRVNEQQIYADNVVVLFVTHEYFQNPPAEIIEILLAGSGPGYAFRDGKAYQVVWNRPTADSVLFLTLPDGSNFPFKPGKTWFQVVGNNSVFTQPDENFWRFEFRIP